MSFDRPNWTVSVAQLGKVRDAELELAPLTILVGKNNTGKSYIATLIWSLLNAEEIWLRRGPRYLAMDGTLPKWFDEGFCKPTEESAFFDHLASAFSDWFNGEINKNQRENFARVFAWKGVKAEGIRVRFPRGERLSFHRVAGNNLEDEDAIASFSLISGELDDRIVEYELNEYDDHLKLWLLRSIASAALNPNNANSSREPIYIPAARTGFVLALREIISGLFDNLEANYEGSASSALPLPLVRFLRVLASEKSDRRVSSAEIADFLESRILSGKVEREEGPVPTFSYLPDSTTRSIPLRAASSMVTELAPFLQVLRTKDLSAGVIFEEPEAHLHIAAQREMARAIIRLVNSGVPVTITTHSDTFLHQLNLLISAYSEPETAKNLGYDASDMLDPKMAKAYEFCSEGDYTSVREAKRTEYGFVIPSINMVLEEMARQTLEMQP